MGGIEGAKTTGANTPTKSFLACWPSSAMTSMTSFQDEVDRENGPVEELILAGTVFGEYILFLFGRVVFV